MDEAKDVAEPVELPQVDQPPRAGVFVEHDDLALTAAEIADGNMLGEAIDVDDDNDSGGAVSAR
jgi:hypothetical protein